MAILAPLRHRPFRLLFAGQAISDLGDWLSYLAIIALIIYRWQLGAAALAALSVVMILPWAVVAPIAGVWTDRWPRRTVMVVSDLLRAGLALALVWASDLYTVLALVGGIGVVSTFFSPARQASIRDTVPEEDLLAANSLSQLSIQFGKIIGPAIGGVIVSLAGPGAAFGVNALTFLVSALFLIQLPQLLPVPLGAQAEKRSFWGEFRSGITFILRSRALSIAVIGMGAVMFVIFTFDSLGALALEALGVDESTLGLAVGSIGLGTALGATAIGQWGSHVNPFRIMTIGVVASGVMVAFLGSAVLLNLKMAGLFWLPVWFVTGLGAAAMFVPYGYILQSETPSELMGRVSASAQGLQTVFQLLAPIIGAFLAEAVGVGFVFAVAGIALVMVGIVVFLIPAVRAKPGDAATASSA